MNNVAVHARASACLLIVVASCLAAQSRTLDLAGESPLSATDVATSPINVLTLGLRISSDFDDNALNSNQDQQKNLATSIQPQLGWHLSRARFGWLAEYAPGFTRSQSLSAYDSFSHVLDSRFQLKLTKRWKLRVQETLLKSTNPFDQLHEPESASSSAIRGPANIVAATSTDVRTERASMDIAYALSAHSAANITGELFSSRYSLRPGVQVSSQITQNSWSAGVHGHYDRQLARHQWAGLDYHAQQLVFNSGQSSSLVQSVVYIHTVDLSGSLTVACFIGPEHSVTDASPLLPDLIGRRSIWDWTGGAAARWTGTRTSVTGSFTKKVGDGGVLGAAQVAKIGAEFKRHFARNWTAALLASYDRSKALATPRALSYAWAAAGLTRTFGPNLKFEFQYWRLYLLSKNSLPATFLADHNRISMSLIYDFKFPLGR